MAPVINTRNFYNNILNSNAMRKFIPDNPTDIAATLALISTTTKDAVNCYYYVTQSLNNKKIPEEKRKFVAGIDLSNGILNVVIQFALGSLVNNYSSKLFDSWFGKKLFSKDAAKNLYDRMKAAGLNYQEDQVLKGMESNKKWAKAGFKVMAVLLVTQVIAKRVIVPFLSTPMAGVFKEQLEKREKKQAAKKLGQEQPPKVEKEDKKQETKAAPAAEQLKAEAPLAANDPFSALATKDVKFKKA